jgi:hypothetical protein
MPDFGEKQHSKKMGLAPWHFHPEHREMRPDGTWKIPAFHSRSRFEDPDTTSNWTGFPPPTYSPEKFLSEPQFQEYRARHQSSSSTTASLPLWVHSYIEKEEGPRTVTELQNQKLLAQNNELRVQLQAQMEKYDILERTLAKTMEHHQKDMQRKDKRRRPNKKRQRLNTNGGTSTTLTNEPQQSQLEDEDNDDTDDEDDDDGLESDHNFTMGDDALFESTHILHRMSAFNGAPSRQDSGRMNNDQDTAFHPHRNNNLRTNSSDLLRWMTQFR